MSPLLALSDPEASSAPVERTAVSAQAAARDEDERAGGLESWSRALRRQADQARGRAARLHGEGHQLIILGQQARVDGQTAVFRAFANGSPAAAGIRLQEHGRQVEDEGRRRLRQAGREDDRAAAVERTARELEREAGRARRRAAGLRIRAALAERRGALTYRLRR